VRGGATPLLLALGLILPGAVPAVVAQAVTVAWHPARPRVGDVAWVHVRGVSETAVLEGSTLGQPLRFFPHAGGQAALVGVDLQAKPGPQPWRVVVVEPQQEPRALHGTLRLESRAFPVQRLTLPPTMVDLDPQTERRAVAEGEQLRTLYRTVTVERLWRGPFTRPVAGSEPGTGFGAQRVINGKPRAPHSGLDFAAPRGAPVVAVNAGRIALVAEFFFPGRLVAIDHGLGLYTLYFHLDEASVSAGDVVERGQPIGTVGATGRATGPHLHFAAQVGIARIDPAALLGLRVLD
jgi:murein DD-endopeptidase MepM/ murein hydrolase activator NlpD